MFHVKNISLINYSLDDLIDGSHSFIDTCEHLKICGAGKVYIIGCHGILSGHSLEEIEDSKCVDGVIVTNTYPISRERIKTSKKLHVIDLSGVLAEAIRRTHNGESISYVYICL